MEDQKAEQKRNPLTFGVKVALVIGTIYLLVNTAVRLGCGAGQAGAPFFCGDLAGTLQYVLPNAILGYVIGFIIGYIIIAILNKKKFW